MPDDRRRSAGMLGRIVNCVRREPVAFQGVIQTSLALLVGFGLIAWTAEQTALAMGFCAALLGFLARSQVTPTTAAPAEAAKTEAAAAGPDEAARLA
jgi:hypothetical protein